MDWRPYSSVLTTADHGSDRVEPKLRHGRMSRGDAFGQRLTERLDRVAQMQGAERRRDSSGLGDTRSMEWHRAQLLSTKVLPRCSAGEAASTCVVMMSASASSVATVQLHGGIHP